MSNNKEVYEMTTEERLQEVKDVTLMLNKYEQMNDTKVNGESVKINNTNPQQLNIQTLIESTKSKEINKEENFMDGIMFDIILFFVIIIIGQILAVKYDMDEIKKISYVLAIFVPYLI